VSDNKVSSTQLLIASIVQSAIEPALALLPFKLGSGLAMVQLVAIGLQESDLLARKQVGGPARGLWQFEQGSSTKGGGVWGVFKHPQSKEYLRELCEARGVAFDPVAIYRSLQFDDVLAAGVARLLMWTDRPPLPTTQEQGWEMYAKRTWVPGKPHPEKWPPCWYAAVSYGMANGWVKAGEKGSLDDTWRK
jgi:hypothetical protein